MQQGGGKGQGLPTYQGHGILGKLLKLGKTQVQNQGKKITSYTGHGGILFYLSFKISPLMLSSRYLLSIQKYWFSSPSVILGKALTSCLSQSRVLPLSHHGLLALLNSNKNIDFWRAYYVPGAF